ncbi:MAG: [FeFe] hydrogenase H-cluster radical SAM maturase HydG [Candidatus Kapaibacterium sp.]
MQKIQKISDQFIDEAAIHHLIEKSNSPGDEEIAIILDKALEMKGLPPEDVATLLNIEDPEHLGKLFATALRVKQEIYGNRLVLFAPLYVSNYCANNCLYCGFRADNREIERRALSIDEIKAETRAILEQGHKRILLLMGENHQKSNLDYFIEAINAIYSVRDSKGNSIRRINIEIAPLDENEFAKIREVPIGTYTVFQETYHRETYKYMHPSGKKADYNWRVTTMDRALANGMHDVGIGALFGLYDYRFEVLALMMHARHLDEKFGVGPHTISIPRIKPARNAPAAEHIPHAVSDTDFKKLVAVIRLAVPYTGMILSTRETAALRSELFDLGVSQISAGSKTNPGGYKQAFSNKGDDGGQFNLNDCRSSGEVIADVIDRGFVPSFCTACYRLGRVGKDFMDQAKPGLIKLFCQPNGLTTLKEYLMDYADEETRRAGEKLIERELESIPNEKVKEKTREFLRRIELGERDLYI